VLTLGTLGPLLVCSSCSGISYSQSSRSIIYSELRCLSESIETAQQRFPRPTPTQLESLESRDILKVGENVGKMDGNNSRSSHEVVRILQGRSTLFPPIRILIVACHIRRDRSDASEANHLAAGVTTRSRNRGLEQVTITTVKILPIKWIDLRLLCRIYI
jgi:hypothetical protein